MKHFLCVTSLLSEKAQEHLHAMAVQAMPHTDWHIVVTSDVGSPDMLGVMSIKDQENTEYSYAKIAPKKNYCRKNIAYLEAMKLGADIISETDDDSILDEKFFAEVPEIVDVKLAGYPGEWVNVYKYFTDKLIWPRGFNLKEVHAPLRHYVSLGTANLCCPIKSFLIDNDPDVDAIYRLLLPLPFDFWPDLSRVIALSYFSWCPFNSQNTAWYKKVFPLMYLPATCQFREADILRSYVAQRILWANNWNVSFGAPTLKQQRNPHDLIDDLRQETKLYGYMGEVCEKLGALDILPGAENFKENMLKCYKVYSDYDFISPYMEERLIGAWFHDINHTLHV